MVHESSFRNLLLVSWADHSFLFKIERREQFALGHKKGKSSENCHNIVKTMNYFLRIASLLRAKERITSKSLMTLF